MGKRAGEGVAGAVAGSRMPDGKRESAVCDFCGVARLVWRKCKLVCEACGNINKSCADL